LYSHTRTSEARLFFCIIEYLIFLNIGIMFLWFLFCCFLLLFFFFNKCCWGTEKNLECRAYWKRETERDREIERKEIEINDEKKEHNITNERNYSTIAKKKQKNKKIKTENISLIIQWLGALKRWRHEPQFDRTNPEGVVDGEGGGSWEDIIRDI